MTAVRLWNRSSWVWLMAGIGGQLVTLGCSGGEPGAGMDPLTPPAATGTGPGVAPSSGIPGGGPEATGPVIGTTAGPDGNTTPSSVGGTINPVPADPTGGTAPTVVPRADEPSAGFMRRLTHIEFDNTIADLLGLEGQPSSGFASDIASQGFTNNSAGQNVTPTLAEQYIEVVEGLSRQTTRNLNGLLGCDPATTGEETCVQQFITEFGKRAWRRPLSEEEQGRALNFFRTTRAQYELDVSSQLLVQFFLLSPQFLYLVEPLPAGAAPGSMVALDSWKVASRLSYFLRGSMPDAELFAAAEAGTLNTAEAVGAEARRLLQQPRARARIGLFFTEWLRLRHIDKLQKDTVMFPDFDLSLGPLLRQQVEMFAQAVILDDAGTVTDLLTAPFTFVNNRLAPLYGVTATAGSTMSRVNLDPAQRAGLLTHAALLATLAHQNQTDPVVRGKFVRESVLCNSVPPVPVGLVVTTPVITPGSTTRERFRQHQDDPNCSGCHMLMDPIGLGFENYDPLGQWRDMDNGLPVDATGEVIGTDVAGTFNGAIELAHKLAQSEQVSECFTKTWLRFALGRSEQEADQGALTVAGDKFASSGFKMSELLVALTETNTFRYQRVLDPNTTALADSSTSASEEETP